MTSPEHLSGLHCYPVKSLRGHALDNAVVGARGVSGDRRWMIVDAGGRFITRREAPEMALFDVRPDGEGLLIDHPVFGIHRAARPEVDAPRIEARVWRDTVLVRVTDTGTGRYLTEAFGKPVRLVYQHDESVRPVDARYAAQADQVSLADGFPVLVTSHASLAALNRQLAVPIEMHRFRPNLIVEGGAAWGEDRWRRIRIGDVTFRIAKPCSRCIIITQHPLTGAREQGNEPLTTLRAIGRMTKGGIMFGQNAIPDAGGTIRIGDPIEILETGASNLG